MALLIVDGLTNVQTTHINAGQTTYNYGIATGINPGVGATANYRGLLRFDISGLPADATIVSAEVRMYCNLEGATTNRNIAFHRALTQWYEGLKNGAAPDALQDGSTWALRNANGAVAWGAAGGLSGTDYAAVATSSTSITADNTYFAWDVTADVAAWYAGTAVNYGWWLINSDESTANSYKQFYTEEYTTSLNQRPVLFIEYTLSGQTSTVLRAAHDTNIYQFSPNNNYGLATNITTGGVTVDYAYRAWVDFDLSGVPEGATIHGARLWLFCEAEGATTDRAVAARRALTQWYEGLQTAGVPAGGEDASTWSFRNYNGSVAWAGGAGGGAGTDRAADATATTTITAPGLWFSWDVTTDVQWFVDSTYTNLGWWLMSVEGVANAYKRFSARVQSGQSCCTGILEVDYTLATLPIEENHEGATPDDDYDEVVDPDTDLSYNVGCALPSGSTQGLAVGHTTNADKYGRKNFEPPADNTYGFRLYWNQGTFTTDSGTAMVFMQVDDGGSNRSKITLERTAGGDYKVYASVVDDGSVTRSVASVTFAAATHWFEIQVTQATGVAASDAIIRMYMDGVLVGELLNVDLWDLSKPNNFKVGSMGADVSAAGSFCIDKIKLQAGNDPIGPYGAGGRRSKQGIVGHSIITSFVG